MTTLRFTRAQATLRQIRPALARGIAGAAMLTAVLGVSGCKDPALFAPGCPAADILASAADYFDYGTQSPEMRHLVIHAALTGMTGACEDGPNGKGSVRSRMTVRMTALRGPAGESSSVDVPFFVAITHNGKIIDKKIFTQTITFASALSQTDVVSRVLIIDLPDAARQDPDSYRMEIGYQLTEGQLNYNRAHLIPAHFKQL